MQIDTLCQTNGIKADSAFVEKFNRIDIERFFSKYEQYGSSEENPVNPCFSPLIQDLENQVLLQAAEGITEDELKQYISSSESSDTLVLLQRAIHQNMLKNSSINLKQSFTGLPDFTFNRQFISFLHCGGYQFDTVFFWKDSLKRIEIELSADISFNFDSNKLLCARKSGMFGSVSTRYKEVSMVTISGVLPIYENENYRVVKLYNPKKTLEMTLVLPRSEHGLNVVNDSAQHLLDLPVISDSVMITLPICTSRTHTTAVSRYNYYNVRTPFSKSDADFKHINDTAYLYIDAMSNSSEVSWDTSGIHISQTGYIQLNENFRSNSSFQGMVEYYNLVVSQKSFVDCYPFVYMVKDRCSNRIICIGKLVEP
ncbi:MAG: hypothetical protein JW915_24690 [Chitinispirillaceae bacterium]|nr:hypothetical protein [Chitinispirillaceae bacterium]